MPRRTDPAPARRRRAPRVRRAHVPLRRELRARTGALKDLLEQARNRYVSLFDMAPIGYAVMDENGRIDSLNLTLCTMLGQLRAYMVGLPFLLWVIPEDRRRLLKYLQDCRRSRGEPITCDLALMGSTRQGTLPVHLSSRRIAADNGQSAYLVAVLDVRERAETIRALEASGRQLRRSAEALQERTSEAELATGRLRDLAREVNKAEQRERQRIGRLLHDDLQQLLVSAKMRLGTVSSMKSAARQKQLREVTTLLDAAINSSRSLTAQLSPPLLEDAGLEAGLRWLARSLQEKHGLRVSLDLALGSEPIDINDRDFLFHAAREMLFNVVKHAGVRKATLKASVQDREVRLEVSDGGAGFDLAVLDQKESAIGDRLGLRTLRERAQLLGGGFVLETQPGKGVRVQVFFPLGDIETAAAKEPIAAVPASPPAAAVAASGLVRVLIADDHRVVREGLQSFLSRERWLEIVGQAADGRQAVLMTRQLQPDVVIMDISMPELNGIEATRIITGENPHVRIIGLSMHQQEDMASAMLAAGAERYLTKGGPAEDLVRAVRELSIASHPDQHDGTRPGSPA